MNSRRNDSRQGSGRSRCPGCTLTSCLLCKHGPEAPAHSQNPWRWKHGGGPGPFPNSPGMLHPIPQLPGNGQKAPARSQTLQGCPCRRAGDIPDPGSPPIWGSPTQKFPVFKALLDFFPGSSQRQSCPHPLGEPLRVSPDSTLRVLAHPPCSFAGKHRKFHQNPASRTRNSHRFRGGDAIPDQPLPDASPAWESTPGAFPAFPTAQDPLRAALGDSTRPSRSC